MSRLPRLHVPGAFYHVTLRGNHRQPIFARATDREVLAYIVRESIELERARVHAYCWMTNHIHVLIQISDSPLGRLIQRIASRFARTVQARVPTTGHLFECRYHARLVDVDAYLLTVIRYIHENPVEAGLAKVPSDYCWSSHGVYAGERDESWVTTDFVLAMLGFDRTRAVQNYQEFMREPADIEPAANPSDARVLGDDEFLGSLRVLGMADNPRTSLEKLIAEAARHFGVSPHEITSPCRGRKLAVARAWIAHCAVGQGIANVCDIAKSLKRHEASVRGLMRRHPAVPEE